MEFHNQYKKVIVKEQRISRSQIQPHNIYRISVYKYTKGSTENIRETLFFCTGVLKLENKLYGLKLTDIKPENFFNWTKEVVKYPELLENDEELINFSELLPTMDIGGKRLYESYLKNSKFLKSYKRTPFRSYNLDGIKYVSKVFINKNILKDYYG